MSAYSILPLFFLPPLFYIAYGAAVGYRQREEGIGIMGGFCPERLIVSHEGDEGFIGLYTEQMFRNHIIERLTHMPDWCAAVLH